MTAEDTYKFIKEHISNEQKCIESIQQEFDIRRLEGTIINGNARILKYIDKEYPIKTMGTTNSKMERGTSDPRGNLDPTRVFDKEEGIEEL